MKKIFLKKRIQKFPENVDIVSIKKIYKNTHKRIEIMYLSHF